MINKKVSIETAKDDIKEIWEKYKGEYTDIDFDALGEDLLFNIFGTL